ncbi:unnamed protein product [Miscanthus lutarioriparius]|uniref:UDP-glycosyltransferases domain-containing protein n=1 Tax=Miscanthus lutarioriparius TaxID=422564 RepID=A0A811SLX5_9POAL|nr:unnamed protein product [Miscanthus lutarioriparius]
MSEECARSLPALTRMLSELRETTRLVAFVADQFGMDSFDAARDAGVSTRCLFMPMNLHALSLVLRLPDLAASVSGEFRDLAEPVQPVHLAKRYREADAILVNSFDAVEPEVAQVLRQPERGRPPVYPIGPLIRQSGVIPPSSPPRAACLEWLDRQPARSVIFVSFGSAGALPKEQTHQLALGLELSGQRFLWVVRSPSDEGTLSDNYYNAESNKDPFAYLPEGFLERTKDVGLLVPSWAPQTQVLAHMATGGFLTHCGWNSTLESLVHGVPMLAWPLFAEQRLNAVMLAEGVGAAIRLPERKDKETIASVVRELMVGEGKGAMVRVKVAELQNAAAEGLRDGGAATTALDEVVEKWEAEAN